jgi:hypothetical protein
VYSLESAERIYNQSLEKQSEVAIRFFLFSYSFAVFFRD